MADTEKVFRNVYAPSVSFLANSDGKITVRLACYRQKANGDSERMVLDFGPLTVDQVACFGNDARRSVYSALERYKARAEAAYNRITNKGATL